MRIARTPLAVEDADLGSPQGPDQDPEAVELDVPVPLSSEHAVHQRNRVHPGRVDRGLDRRVVAGSVRRHERLHCHALTCGE
jgi:hypothetical protein